MLLLNIIKIMLKTEMIYNKASDAHGMFVRRREHQFAAILRQISTSASIGFRYYSK
jgi:hypothetical protein